MVNTEHYNSLPDEIKHYNILNIVVNTEQIFLGINGQTDYNILNIVVNTEHIFSLY